MQLPHHLLHPSQILRWDGFFQFPDDIHGLAAGMADIGGFAQEGIGRGAQGVLLELDEDLGRTFARGAAHDVIARVAVKLDDEKQLVQRSFQVRGAFGRMGGT